MTITTKQNRGWIVALGATPLLALMLSVGIGHADSRSRGGNPGGGHERGSAGSWSGGRGGSSWRGGGNGGRDYSRGGHSGGGYSGGGYTRGGYSGGYTRGGYSGGYTRGGYSGGYSRGGIRYRPSYGYSGGYRRYGPRGYYYPRSRSYIHFGVGFGYPYPYYAPTRVVVARPVRTILIANYPPSGCYYYDPYCDMRFDCLDDYYEHMQDCGHDATLEVIDGSGDCVGTYGYVNGEWTIEN